MGQMMPLYVKEDQQHSLVYWLGITGVGVEMYY